MRARGPMGPSTTVTGTGSLLLRPLRVGEDEQQLGLAGGVAADVGPAGTLAGAGGHAAQLHLELEHVTGDDLTPEACLLDTAEQRQLAGEAVVGEHGVGAQLG